MVNSGPCNSFNCLGHFKNVYDDDDELLFDNETTHQDQYRLQIQKMSLRIIKNARSVSMTATVRLQTTAVSVFSNNVSMATLGSNTQTLADLETETRGVEHRSTANHTMHRQTTQLPCHVRHHVHCMSHNSISSFTLLSLWTI